MRRALVTPLLLITLAGCATTHGLTPLALEGSPVATSRKDPGFDPAKYATFSVFPLNLVNPQCALKDDAAARPLLFMLRNAMEKRGYRFVQLNESPDLLVTIDLQSSGGLEKPPKTIKTPNLAPGGMIPDPRTALGLLNAAYTVYGWGTWPPKPEAIAPLPGYPPRSNAPKEKRKPGYTFTSVAVAIVDAKTAVEVWTGAGAGVARNPDPRIAIQLPFWSVMQAFPTAQTAELLSGSAGVPGLDAEIFTNDGIHYFPSIVGVDPGSSCWKTGVGRLDMIVAMDGESTADQPYSKFVGRLAGPDKSSITVTVWREGDQIHIQVPREPLAPGAASAARAAPPAPPVAKDGKPKTADLEIPRTVAEYGMTVPVFGGAILLLLIVAAVAG